MIRRNTESVGWTWSHLFPRLFDGVVNDVDGAGGANSLREEDLIESRQRCQQDTRKKPIHEYVVSDDDSRAEMGDVAHTPSKSGTADRVPVATES